MNLVEIARLCHEAGWRGGNLVVAVAVCLGESEGNPRAFNGRGNDLSYGLFQVNVRGPLGPERRARYGLSSDEDLFDPATNVRVAYDIFVRAGHSFTPWGAFTSGGYKKFGRFEKAQTAVAELGAVSLQYDRPSGYTTAIPSGVQALRYGIAEWFGLTRSEVIRDRSRCQQHSSEHCVCRAVDEFTTTKGDVIFDFCVWAAARLGIQSVIWQHREWGFGKWYERYRSKADHFDHVHFGVNKWGAANVTRAMVDAALREYFEEDWFDMATKEELKEAIREVLDEEPSKREPRGLRYLVKRIHGALHYQEPGQEYPFYSDRIARLEEALTPTEPE